MGISNNSHGKKSDKETQSPLLKIFKEIMMRENNDPEKRNLLDQKEDRKRKQYNGSKAKLDRRSVESNSSVHRKRSPYKVISAEQRNANLVRANQSGVFLNEKKESWWNWNTPKVPIETADDTCSCVSCALKRIVSSEYACIGCLVLVFCISIVVACLLVFKNIPTVATECPPKLSSGKPMVGSKGATTLSDSDRLKRKIELINESRMKNELSEEGVFGKPHYDDIRSDPMDLPGSSEIDFGPNLRELNGLEDSESKNLGDMELSPLQPENIEMHSSDKLKEFYTKLVQTDAKIKNLKKIIAESNVYNNVYDGRTPDRTKRSLKLYHQPNQALRRKRDTNFPGNQLKRLPKRKSRMKRFGNASDDSTGFVIEKKKLIVQYKPNSAKKLVVKCSHSPKDGHAHQHEHQLKHPFYQNTQRLDELLDRFLNKNLPEIISDPFGLDFLFKPNKNKCKHPQPTMNVDIISTTEKDEVTKKKQDKATTNIADISKFDTSDNIYNDVKLISCSNNGRTQIPKPKAKGKKLKEKHRKFSTTVIKPTSDIMKMLRPESTTVYENDFYEHKVQMINKEKLKIVTSSPSDFEVLLSVSTIMNPKIKKAAKVTDSFLLDQPPNLRRLMQMDGEEEENLGYEDLKEVLRDEMESQEEVDKRGDRKRRNEELEEYNTLEATPTNTKLNQEIPEKAVKYNPPGVQNPNWKGPMPLYPDEINSMIKQAAMNANKPLGALPEAKDIPNLQNNRQSRDVSDVEYVEDYLDNKYDKLVEMAQAYSDYGVLEGKKDTVRNEKNPATDNISVDNRVKLSADETSIRGRYLLGSQKEEQYGTIPSPSQNVRSTPHSEGIRLEVLPTTQSRLDDVHVYRFLNSHIRIDSDEPKSIIEKPNAVQISLYPSFELPYNPRMELTSIDNNLKAKEESNTEEIADISNNLAVSKGRTLLSTIFKGYDDGLGKDETGSDTNDDTYVEQSNKIKRDIESEIETIDENSADETITYLNKEDSVTVATQELQDYYLSQATKTNIDIYSYPYLKEAPTISPYTPGISAPAVVIPNPNITSFSNENDNDNGIIILGSDQDLYTTINVDQNSIVINDLMQSINATEDLEDIVYNTEQFESNSNVTSQMEFKSGDVEVDDKPSITDESAINKNKSIAMQDLILELEQNDDADPKFNSNETLISIDHCQMKPKDVEQTKYEGQIVLTLKNPEFGVENIELNFDASFLVNSQDSAEQVEIENEETVATTTMPASFMASVSGKRGKRDVNSTEKDKAANVTELQEEASKRGIANNTKTLSKDLSDNNVTYNANTVNDNMTLSEFFMMISNWFKTLEGIKSDADTSKLHPVTDIAGLLVHFNNASNKSKNVNISSTTEATYPSYDSEMIENIGHRSRVLLSVEDSNVTEAEGTSEINVIKVTGVKSANVTEPSSTTAIVSTTVNATNITTTEKDKVTSTNAPKKDSDTRKVKRNADDSNLIFWNDIYDDEYGIQADNLDSVIQDKIYTKENDFIKRSGRWVQDKIRKFAENLKGHDDVVSSKQRMPRAAKRIGDHPKHVYKKMNPKLKKRSSNEQEEDDVDQISVFNTLGANMVEVCKKAAIAVKQTSDTQVKEDPNQSTVATSLMQQLVRLLTDLVDYQVQAKTCAKLPPDLKSFLEWLTYPDEEVNSTEREPQTVTVSAHYKNTASYPDEEVIDELVNAEHGFSTSMSPIEGLEEKGDYKSQYLDTLRSVQDLLDQYEEMSDEDKSKMTGVKFYLQNQLRYLNKQFTGYDMYNFFDKHGLPLLYKRELPLKEQKRSNLRRKRKPYKFVKSFGKKHTRTTASFYDGIPVTDLKRVKEAYDPRVGSHNHQDRLKPTEPKNVKRNLKDVYYKAIAEAKKYATAKNGHKKQETVEFSTTQNTRDQI